MHATAYIIIPQWAISTSLTKSVSIQPLDTMFIISLLIVLVVWRNSMVPTLEVYTTEVFILPSLQVKHYLPLFLEWAMSPAVA